MTDAAFASLYPRLRRYAAFVSDSDVDPDDLVQDALALYLRRFAGTSGADDPPAYLSTAVLGLARNHRRDQARRARLQPVVVEVERPPYPSDTESLLSAMSVEDRALVALVDLEGMSASEAGAVVGLSGVAVRARLSRARRRLRRRIESGDFE